MVNLHFPWILMGNHICRQENQDGNMNISSFSRTNFGFLLIFSVTWLIYFSLDVLWGQQAKMICNKRIKRSEQSMQDHIIFWGASATIKSTGKHVVVAYIKKLLMYYDDMAGAWNPWRIQVRIKMLVSNRNLIFQGSIFCKFQGGYFQF